MTYQKILWAINEAAELAAASALDAFGVGEEIPSAEIAWEFINQQIYAESADERPAGLPNHLTRQFQHDYKRHLNRLIEERISEGRS